MNSRLYLKLLSHPVSAGLQVGGLTAKKKKKKVVRVSYVWNDQQGIDYKDHRLRLKDSLHDQLGPFCFV